MMSTPPREILKGLLARDALSLFDVMQILLDHRLRGRVNLKNHGQIYFSDGRIVGARLGDFVRTKALYRIWTLPHPSVFSVYQMSTVEDMGMRLAVSDLVYIQQQTDEFFALTRRIPLDATVERTTTHLEGEIGQHLNRLLVKPQTVQYLLDQMVDLPDYLVLQTMGRFLAAGQLRLRKGEKILPFTGYRFVNVAILSPREEWLDRFYEDLGLSRFALTKGPRVQYAYMEFPQTRLHLYGIHYAPGMGLLHVRPFLEFAHFHVAIGNFPIELQQQGLIRDRHELIFHSRNGWQKADRSPLDLAAWIQTLLDRV